jgi:hypothetical protein
MFSLKSGKWQWRFLKEEEVFTPPGEAAALLDGAMIVKDNPVTTVFRRDGLFFKWEKDVVKGCRGKIKNRFFSRSAREFATLQKVCKAGFEVTPPVAYGFSDRDCMLITREVSGAVSVLEYLVDRYEKGEPLPEDFLSGWGTFWGKFINSGFYFPDFHCGNVLYAETEKRFVLVDLYGVYKPWTLRAEQKKRMVFRQMKDAMEFLSEQELKLVLKCAGIAGNEQQYTAFLEFYAGKAQELLLRRMRDFDERALRYRPGRKKWNFAETEQRELPETVLDEAWTKDFALQHHGIPHLHLLERDGGKMIMEKSAGVAPEAAENALRKRLEIAGYDPDLFVCCLNSGGRAVVCDRKVVL